MVSGLEIQLFNTMEFLRLLENSFLFVFSIKGNALYEFVKGGVFRLHSAFKWKKGIFFKTNSEILPDAGHLNL